MVRMRPRLFFSVVVECALMAACASTQMTSMLNPEWQSQPYRRILVFFATDDLELRRSFETRFQEHNPIPDVEFIPAFAVLFPGRTYTDLEVTEVLKRAGVDAALVVMQGQSGASTATLPATATTGCTLWRTSQGCLQTETTVSGGGTLHKPWADYSVFLIDLEDTQTIWVATASSSGNAFASWSDLRNSLVSKTIERLTKDRVIIGRR